MNKKNAILTGLVALSFTAIGIYFGYRQMESAPADTSAVSQLLSQTMPDASGKPQSLSQWKGKALIVNFWATWCAPCVEEMPELSSLQTEVEPRVQIIGIGIDSSSNIAEFAGKYKIHYPLYMGGMESTALARQLGNQAGGLPFTILIGPDGKPRKTYLGKLKMNELRQDLAEL